MAIIGCLYVSLLAALMVTAHPAIEKRQTTVANPSSDSTTNTITTIVPLTTSSSSSTDPSSTISSSGSSISTIIITNSPSTSSSTSLIFSGLTTIIGSVVYTLGTDNVPTLVTTTSFPPSSSTSTSSSSFTSIPSEDVGAIIVISPPSSTQASTITITTPPHASPTPSTNASPAVSPLFCGVQPYYAYQYTCFNKGTPNEILCPIGTQACGRACFNPARYYCVTEGHECVPFLSGGWDAICDNQIYATSNYSCNKNKYLCPDSDPLSCGLACYSSERYSCVNKVLRPV